MDDEMMVKDGEFYARKIGKPNTEEKYNRSKNIWEVVSKT